MKFNIIRYFVTLFKSKDKPTAKRETTIAEQNKLLRHKISTAQTTLKVYQAQAKEQSKENLTQINQNYERSHRFRNLAHAYNEGTNNERALQQMKYEHINNILNGKEN